MKVCLDDKKKIIIFLFSLLLALVILPISETLILNGFEFSLFIKLFLIATMFILYFTIYDFKLYSFLIIFSLFFLKPNIYVYWSIVFIFLLIFILQIKKYENIDYISLVCIAIGSFFGFFNSSSLMMGISKSLQTFIIPISLYVLIGFLSIKRKQIVIIFKIEVLIASLVGIIGIIIALNNPNERIGSLWVTAMTINGFYIFLFFISLGFFFYTKKNIEKYFYLLTTLLILMGSIFTYTRMALLAFGFGILLIIIFIKRDWKLLFLSFVLGILLIFFLPSSFKDRLKISNIVDSSMMLRYLAWYNSIIIISKNWLTGIGFDGFYNFYKNNLNEYLWVIHPHNLFFHIFVATGIFGTFGYFNLILRNLYRNIKRGSNNKKYAQLVQFANIGFICLLFAGITDIFIAQFSVALLFWVNLGLIKKFRD